MLYINQDYSLSKLRGLVQQQFTRQINASANELDMEQKHILEILTKRIFLEEIIDETVSFNRKLHWDKQNSSYELTLSAEDLVEVFKLRSEIYERMNYGSEFPDIIEGLNFDNYDRHSAIIFCKKGKEYTGTSRIIFDSKQNRLPTDKKHSFEYLRQEGKRFGETSRFSIKKDEGKLSLDFKSIMRAYYDIITNNNLDMIVSSIAKNHYKLYSKFGGIKIEKELNSFGELEGDFLVISWNPYLASPFYKRTFLG
ncbi:MAG TPA: hypothetical protein CFH79_08700 [Sulfurospirillum sp. UBA11407]|nr:MAG TPA: hypothetical protein CFH79_08700 [Sulfurospirillum sp. UBA11407]